MHHERGRPDPPEQAGNVDRGARLEQPRRHFSGARPPAELVEPADLRLAAAGNEPRREDLAENGILLAQPTRISSVIARYSRSLSEALRFAHPRA
jgi:hypothetical protein